MRLHVSAPNALVLALAGALLAAPSTHAADQCPQTLPGQCQKTAELLVDAPANTTAACCAACVAQPLCIGYTFNTADKRSPHCYLHGNWIASTPGTDCTSGKVREPLTPPARAKNVLLIIVDDLRPQVKGGGYDQDNMSTPNIDALAAESTSFHRAYCQQAICGPTRNSFLSGRRPQRTESWNFIDNFREVGPNWMSLPGYFKKNGYLVLGSGKTYHPGLPPADDGALSWSQDRPYKDLGDGPWVRPKWVNQQGDSLVMPDATPSSNFTHYQDGKNLQVILDDLQYALTNKSGTPFFLALGLHKPHLDFHAPADMWQLYGDTEDIALPKHREAPTGMPPIAFTYELDGKTTLDILGSSYPVPFPHADVLPDLPTRQMRQGYYMAVSFTDSLIGRAMAALKASGKADDTVVALIGDHGWSLGSKSIWGKHTNFEEATRVPLIIHAPGAPAGQVSQHLVESVDLYPTLASLAGLDMPPDVDGTDLSPLVLGPAAAVADAAASQSPSLSPSLSWTNKTAVFSEYPRCPANVSQPWGDTTSCVHTHRTNFTVMGYSVRSLQYRYTVWLWWDAVHLRGDFSRDPVGVELYSHAGDDEDVFGAYENVNLAGDPAHASVQAQHHAMAVAQWGQS